MTRLFPDCARRAQDAQAVMAGVFYAYVVASLVRQAALLAGHTAGQVDCKQPPAGIAVAAIALVHKVECGGVCSSGGLRKEHLGRECVAAASWHASRTPRGARVDSLYLRNAKTMTNCWYIVHVSYSSPLNTQPLPPPEVKKKHRGCGLAKLRALPESLTV